MGRTDGTRKPAWILGFRAVARSGPVLASPSRNAIPSSNVTEVLRVPPQQRSSFDPPPPRPAPSGSFDARPRPGNLAQLVGAQLRRTPDAVAVRFDGHSLTCSELALRSGALADRLMAMGVGPDVLVTVFAERSMELVVGLVATLEAGGAYVPVDPGYPPARIRYMVDDAAAPVVLTQSHLADAISAPAGSVVVLDAEAAEGSAPRGGGAPGGGVLRMDPRPSNLAYVIYTSGSTGRPKGVMNTHAGICNRLLWMQEQFGLTSADRVLQKTPYSFDVSVWELFWPLMTGAPLVMAKPGGHHDPSYLAELIEREGVTVVHFVPSMLQLFLETDRLLERCASLRLVVCSGEALTPALTRRFFERLGPTGAELFNLYGPTEAAVDVTYWRCEPDHPGTRPVPIGHPVSNTQIHLLHDDLSPVPVGQQGELFIGGVQVARGYLNRPELTAERFLPDPFSREPGARLYRTGDLARAREDGAIEFLGRTDDQVKVRGFRIELGEIEATLEEHPDVTRAVVTARDEPGTGKRLVAHYVPASERPDPPTSTLRSFVAARLPDYMMPAAFVRVARLPLTPNGKVDRAALPDPERRRPDLEHPFVPPRDGLERHIAEEWARILDLDRVGVRDRFFELGGDSIQAARFVQSMRGELSEFIYVTTVFEAPSPQEYARLLRRDYRDAVARRFGVDAAGRRPEGRSAAGHDVRVDDDMLRAFVGIVPTVALEDAPPRDASDKNPRAVFVLAPPRSGTTLLRVMLAGHPRLFAASELQLLGFHSLAERERAYSGKFGLWLEGTIRVLMELLGCDADEAKKSMAEAVAAGSTTKQFYLKLQQLIGDRILVDKSPSYAMDLGALHKAERDFEEPFYVHLVRHPYSVVNSFERYHMDQVLYLRPHTFAPRLLGELVWSASHRNTLDFLEGVPGRRQHRIRYEELVVRPREVMQGLCDQLGLEFDEGLVEPYQDLDRKMTDGLYSTSTPMGDTKLLERTSIDARAAESWKGVLEDDFLGDVTWELASRLGYERPVGSRTPPGRSERRRAAGQRREQRVEARTRRAGGNG